MAHIMMLTLLKWRLKIAGSMGFKNGCCGSKSCLLLELRMKVEVTTPRIEW